MKKIEVKDNHDSWYKNRHIKTERKIIIATPTDEHKREFPEAKAMYLDQYGTIYGYTTDDIDLDDNKIVSQLKHLINEEINKEMKVVFVADYFIDEIPNGGAEMCDEGYIKAFESFGCEVKKIKSKNLCVKK